MTVHSVELRILGPTELTTAGTRTGGVVLRQPKRLALLAYLSLAASNGFRRRDQIVAMFWPDRDQLHARTQLRKAIYTIRGVLGSDAFITRGEEEIRVNANVVWCDAIAFRQACEAREWRRAFDLYRGDLLEGLYPSGVGQEWEVWLDEQRALLREDAARAAWECSALADLSGHRDSAIALARRAIELKPDDEQSVRRLIAVLDRYGDRGGALRAFGEWQNRLLAEFGAEPAPETRKLARKVQSVRKGESLETPGMLTAVPPPAEPPAQVPPPVAPATRARFTLRHLAVAATSLIVVFTVAAFVAMGRPSTDRADLAVLPFIGVKDSVASIIGESIAEEITTALAQQGELKVRSHLSTRDMLNGLADGTAIAKLEVAHVIQGSILRKANRLHVRARLVRVSDGRTLWARTFDVDGDDLIESHLQIATLAAREVSGVLLSGAPSGVPSR